MCFYAHGAQLFKNKVVILIIYFFIIIFTFKSINDTLKLTSILCIHCCLDHFLCAFCKSPAASFSKVLKYVHTAGMIPILSRQERADCGFCSHHYNTLFWPCCFNYNSVSAENWKCTFGIFTAENFWWLNIRCISSYSDLSSWLVGLSMLPQHEQQRCAKH